MKTRPEEAARRPRRTLTPRNILNVLGWTLFNDFISRTLIRPDDRTAHGKTADRKTADETAVPAAAPRLDFGVILERYMVLLLTTHYKGSLAAASGDSTVPAIAYPDLKFHIVPSFIRARRRFLKEAEANGYPRNRFDYARVTDWGIAYGGHGEAEHFAQQFGRRLAISSTHLPHKTNPRARRTYTSAHRLLFAFLRCYRRRDDDGGGALITVQPFRQREIARDEIRENDPDLLAALRTIESLFDAEGGNFQRYSKASSLRNSCGYLHIRVGCSVVPVPEEMSLPQVLQCLPPFIDPVALPQGQGKTFVPTEVYTCFLDLVKELGHTYLRWSLTGLPLSLMVAEGAETAAVPPNGKRAPGRGQPKALSAAKLKTLSALYVQAARTAEREGRSFSYQQPGTQDLERAWNDLYGPTASGVRKVAGYTTFNALMKTPEGQLFAGLQPRDKIALPPQPESTALNRVLDDGLLAEERDALESIQRSQGVVPLDDLPGLAACHDPFRQVGAFPYGVFPPTKRPQLLGWLLSHLAADDCLWQQSRWPDRYFQTLGYCQSPAEAAIRFRQDLASHNDDTRRSAERLRDELASRKPFAWLAAAGDAERLEVYDFFWRRLRRRPDPDWHIRWSERSLDSGTPATEAM